MSKKLSQVLASAALAASLGAWGVSQASATITFAIRDASGNSSATVTSAGTVTLNLYAQFSGSNGGIFDTRGSFVASSTTVTGGITSVSVASPSLTSQPGVSTNINGDSVTDWGDLASNNASGNSNFFFFRPSDVSSQISIAAASGSPLQVLLGTITLNLTGGSGTVGVSYVLSNPLGDSNYRTMWAENYAPVTDTSGRITGYTNTYNEVANSGMIAFSPFTLTFSTGPAVNTWTAASGADWNVNTSWSGGANPDAAGAGVVFGNTTGTVAATVTGAHTVGAVTFNGSGTYTLSGSGSITLSQGALANSSITVAGANAQTISVPVTVASPTTITTGAGPLNLASVSINPGNTLTVAAGSTVRATSLNSLTAEGGGALVVNGSFSLGIDGSAGRQSRGIVTVLDDLTVGGSGLFDIGNHDLIIRGQSAKYSYYASLIAAGATGGLDWSGTTGITSSAAKNDPNFGTALGIITVEEFGLDGTLFDGVTVHDGDVLIKYTYYGDTDLSGTVDTGNDFPNFLYGLNTPGGAGGWGEGDTNYDGVVDTANDFPNFLFGINAYQGAPAPLAVGAVSAAPEPASLGLLALGGVALLAKRRK